MSIQNIIISLKKLYLNFRGKNHFIQNLQPYFVLLSTATWTWNISTNLGTFPAVRFNTGWYDSRFATEGNSRFQVFGLFFHFCLPG